MVGIITAQDIQSTCLVTHKMAWLAESALRGRTRPYTEIELRAYLRFGPNSNAAGAHP